MAFMQFEHSIETILVLPEVTPKSAERLAGLCAAVGATSVAVVLRVRIRRQGHQDACDVLVVKAWPGGHQAVRTLDLSSQVKCGRLSGGRIGVLDQSLRAVERLRAPRQAVRLPVKKSRSTS